MKGTYLHVIQVVDDQITKESMEIGGMTINELKETISKIGRTKDPDAELKEKIKEYAKKSGFENDVIKAMICEDSISLFKRASEIVDDTPENFVKQLFLNNVGAINILKFVACL